MCTTRPDVGLQRVQAGAPGGRNPLVTVDENPSGLGIGHHHNGQKLAVADQRVGQTGNLSGPSDAGMAIGKLQMDDLDGVYGDGPGHRLAVSDAPGKVPRVVSLQDGPLTIKLLQLAGINWKIRFDAYLFARFADCTGKSS